MVFFKNNTAISSAFLSEGEAFGYAVGEELCETCSEDDAYERFCEVADAFVGTPITAVARFDGGICDGEQIFRSRVRAVYRASVWGQFSLLCVGAVIPEDAIRISEILKEIFCELESEGREFNGFIKKGIEIDAPMLLYKFPQYSRFDFFSFDFGRLAELCGPHGTTDALRKTLAEDICALCRSNSHAEAAIKADSAEEIDTVSGLMPSVKLSRIYVR